MKNSLIRTSVFLFIVFMAASSLKAQETAAVKGRLTGNLLYDSQAASDALQSPAVPELNLQAGQKKSRYLAGLMSLVLPGAGEFYAKDYLKAAIFVAVEAAAITTAVVYNNKGDKQTQFFENYANQHWSVAKYAYWTLKNAQVVNPNINPDDYSNVFRNGVDWHKLGANTNWASLNNDIDWNVLNNLESSLGEGYTHRLPYPGEQQYYELIGKYPQYSHGWDTANLSDTDYHILTSQFLYYSGQRGDANNLYAVGSTAIIFVYINHFLSTLDAIWSVDKYNKSIAMNVRVQSLNMANRIEFVPTVNLSYNF